MFETEDGVYDLSGFSAEQFVSFFEKYPEAKAVSQTETTDYSLYREKGAIRKPEGVELEKVEKKVRVDAGGSSLGTLRPRVKTVETLSKEYTADIEVELEDGSSIYLTPSEMLDANINPNLKSKNKEIKNKFFLPDGSVNKETFKPYEKKVSVSTAGSIQGLEFNIPEIKSELVKPYNEELIYNKNLLKELKQKDLLNRIPEEYRYWEGEEPPEDYVLGYTAYSQSEIEISKAATSEYDKAVATFTKEEQAATRKQSEVDKAKALEFLESDSIKSIDARIESYKNDPKYIQNLNIINKKEYGDELSASEIETYQKNLIDLGTVRTSLYEDYEKMGVAIDELSNADLKLDLLKRDYSLLNKVGFLAESTLGNLSFGLAEFLAQTDNIPGSSNVMEQISIKRRKELDKAREKYRADVGFEEAFSSLDNFGRFIAEEAGRQLPIFALIAASGGAATALGASELGAAMVSGLSLGSMSAGQQIGDMSYQEFLSKYNDIQSYGVNLEFNDKEYSDLNKFLTGVGFGAAEGLLGAAPTFLLGSRFFKSGLNLFSATEKKLAERVGSNALQRALNFGKPIGKAFAIGTGEEAITEGLTTLTQNIITRNPNIFEGVAHATFSGGFFGGIMGGGAVSMGVAMNTSMNSKERLELQNFYDQREKIKTELQYKGLSPEIKKRLEASLADIDKKIDDKTIEVEKMWLSKMSRRDFEQYTEVLGKQADLKQQYLEVTNKNSGLTEQQKKDKIAELSKDYQANHARIEKFRNPLDYANRWHLLETIDKKRYDRIRTQASQKILSEGFEATEAKIKKEAYDIYLLEEIKANNENAKKALKNVGLTFEAFEFKTEKEAKAFAIKKAKEEGIDLSKNSKNKNNFWYGLANAEIGELNGQAGRVGDSYMYVTTEENQLKNEREGTATHEVGHLIFWDWIEKQGLNIDLIAKEITQFLKETNPKIYAEMFGNLKTQRVEVSKETGRFAPEEIIMGFVERIGRIDKDKKVTKTFMYRLGELFNKDVGVTTDLSTQSAIVDFISSMAEKIKDGTLSKADIVAAEESKVFKDLLTKEPSVKEAEKAGVKSSKSNLEGMLDRFVTNINVKEKGSKEVAEKIEQKIAKQVERLKNKTPNKTDEWYRDKAKKIIGAKELISKTFTYPFEESKFAKEIGGIVEAITRRLYDPIPPDLKTVITRTEYKETLIADAGVMVDREYNGTQALDKFVSSRLNLRAQSLATRLGIEQDIKSSIDTDEARQIADEPIAETETETDTEGYTNLVEANVLPTEMVAKMQEKILLVTKTLKSRIDAAVSKNKTVTPLMSEIKEEMGIQADILFKSALGAKRGGELRNNFLKLKKPILENMTTTWLQRAMPFAIQKSVDGKFTSDWKGKKIDRESVETDKAGRTDGKAIVRRLPNAANKITDEQFLTYMFKDNGDVVRGAKESLAKALAQEYAIDTYNKELLNPSSEIRKAFVDNQEMLGTVLADNFVQEFSRQSERGSVKRSYSRLYEADQKNPGTITAFKEGFDTPTFVGYIKANNGNLTKAIIGYFEENPISNLSRADLVKIAKQIGEPAFENMYKFSVKSEKEQSVAEKLKNLIVEEIDNPREYSMTSPDMFIYFGLGDKGVNPRDLNRVNQARIAALYARNNMNYEDFVRAIWPGLQGPGGLAGFKATSTPKSIVLTETEVVPQKTPRGANFQNVEDGKKNLNMQETKGMSRPKAQTTKNWFFDPKFWKLTFKEQIKFVENLYKEGLKEQKIFLDFLDVLTKGINSNDITIEGASELLASQFKSMEGIGKAMAAPRHLVTDGKKILSMDDMFKMGLADKNDAGVLEHMITAKKMAAASLKYLISQDAKYLNEVKDLMKEYNTAVIPNKIDKILREAGTQQKMGLDFKVGDKPAETRYKNTGLMFYDVATGEFVGTMFSPGNLEAVEKNKNIDKAFKNATKRSYSENPKGISVYDFDDTLAFSKSQIIVKKDGKTFKINAAQFAKQGETLLAEGAEFDFSEFNKVVKGQPGPLIPRIQKAIDKFGNKNIFILTARPSASESAIHAFMKGLGIDIPRANITGLANSTAQAKADWMVGKVAEGFNDFYFVDDAIKNVQAVKDVLETFDVKSKVQQAIAKTKRSMSSDLNQMIERNKGVRAETTYSKVLARKQGAKKGKFKFFVPYSAEDFKGLTSYTLSGKGKQGEADQKFFDRTLILPYTRGIAAMEGATQALKNDYKNLLDMFGLKKELPKKIGDTDFTTDQAVRVYLWDQQGFDIPNISKRDQNKLSKLVANNPDLVGFAEGLMAVSKKDNWVDPKEHWDVGSILKDLNDITDNVNRKEYLAEFIENVDEMFDQTTLNKLEAIYGTNYVEALQDSIRRMKSGSNTPRSAGKIERKWLNWVNNSVGTIMFFNRRSALLQMLSFTNFINWSDNNPARAAAAFANQPLYWKKWVEIFNSDKLKERRGGLKSDIQESEIANQAKNSKDKAAAVVSYLLKIGFTPTQIADSFAIATGGATFLINRTKKYEKQGLSKKEAEAKAFEDFGRISDETQQSGDPMLISQQQSSHLGRLILAFQNTPMQYTRLMKKAGKDIVNRRGSDVENLSKIAYYGFVQNLIFSSLQSALFALIPGFDDEEPDDAKLEDKAIRTANSMVDTILRGSGLAGAVVSTLKNAIMRYQKEAKKAEERYGAGDQTYTMLELANISPPIGSKLRKVYSAIQTKRFNQAVIDEMGYDLTTFGKFNPSPNYEIIANIASAAGNLPLDRLLSEIKSINEAFDSRNTSYQRIALALGWRTWDVNVRNEEQDLIKSAAKASKKRASAQRAKDKRKAKSLDRKIKKEADKLEKAELQKIMKSIKSIR